MTEKEIKDALFEIYHARDRWIHRFGGEWASHYLHFYYHRYGDVLEFIRMNQHSHIERFEVPLRAVWDFDGACEEEVSRREAAARTAGAKQRSEDMFLLERLAMKHGFALVPLDKQSAE